MACSDAIASETCRSDLSNGFVGDLVGEVGSVGNASLDDANGSLCDVRGGAVEGGTEGVRGGPSGWLCWVTLTKTSSRIHIAVQIKGTPLDKGGISLRTSKSAFSSADVSR